MKLYLIYKDNSLFAYSNNSNYIDIFREQRNMDIFKIEKINVSNDDYIEFSNKSSNEELTELPLYDGNSYFIMISTIREHNEIFYFVDNIFNNINTITTEMKSINFKKKYRKLFNSISNEVITKTITDDGKTETYINIDMFHLFYHLNKETMN